MLKKALRISKSEFTNYFKIGQRRNSEYFTIVYYPNATFKVAVVVGKKVFKNAVDRNKLRRQVYTVLTEEQKNLTGVYLILVKPTINKKTKSEKRQILNELGRLIK